MTIFGNTKQVIQDYDTVFDNSTPDSGNKIAASAHDMGSGGLAVDAMAIGCLGVDHHVDLFFSYGKRSFSVTTPCASPTRLDTERLAEGETLLHLGLRTV